MTRQGAFRVATTSMRVVLGAVVAAACVVGVGAAVAAPWPGVEHTPARTEVTPVPGDAVLVCNGGFRALGRVPQAADQMTLAGAFSLTVDDGGVAPASVPLDTPGFDASAGAQTLTSAAADGAVPPLAAAESVVLSADDLAGLAAAPCREARTESWIIGGNVDTGSTDLIVLSNPGDVTATVGLTVYGAAPHASSAIVPARTQIALPLASIAAGEQAPVVKVVAEGAPVRAVLQSSLMRTLDPVGIDLQDAVSGPQQHQTIVGVQVFEHVGDDAEATVLRLLVPDADAEATVLVRSVADSSAATDYTVPLIAGEPIDVSLGDLAPGAYSVTVTASEPLLAGVRQQNATADRSDFSWMTAAPEIQAEVPFAVPAGPSPRLYLTNEAETETFVSVVERGGEPRTITVPAQGSAVVDLRPRTGYSIAATEDVHAAVVLSGDGRLAGWPLAAAAAAVQSITVYP